MEFTKGKEGLMRILGDGWRATLGRIEFKPNRYTWMSLGANMFVIYQLEKWSEKWSEEDKETKELDERRVRNIERKTRDLLEFWKQDVQAGNKTMSLDEFRDDLNLNGFMKRYPQFDKLFDEYRKYDQ